MIDTAGDDRRRRLVLGVAVGLHLGLLGIFKYLDFFVTSANELARMLGLRDKRTLDRANLARPGIQDTREPARRAALHAMEVDEPSVRQVGARCAGLHRDQAAVKQLSDSVRMDGPSVRREAATALGLRLGQTLRFVVIPQALRVIVPPMTSQYLNILKNSSFGAVIAFPEIVSLFMGSALNNTGQAIEIVAMTLAFYLVVGLAVSALMNWYNARTAIVSR